MATPDFIPPTETFSSPSPDFIPPHTPSLPKGSQTPSPVMPKGRDAYGHHVLSAAQEFGLDPSLLHGLISQETGNSWSPESYNEKSKALGMTQIIPSTAKSLNIDYNQLKNNPSLQIRGGAKYLSQIINDVKRKYPGLSPQKYEDLALAWYNGGEGEMEKLRQGRPMVPETAAYVPGVRRYASQYTPRPTPSTPTFSTPRAVSSPAGQPTKAAVKPTLPFGLDRIAESLSVGINEKAGALNRLIRGEGLSNGSMSDQYRKDLETLTDVLVMVAIPGLGPMAGLAGLASKAKAAVESRLHPRAGGLIGEAKPVGPAVREGVSKLTGVPVEPPLPTPPPVNTLPGQPGAAFQTAIDEARRREAAVRQAAKEKSTVLLQGGGIPEDTMKLRNNAIAAMKETVPAGSDAANRVVGQRAFTEDRISFYLKNVDRDIMNLALRNAPTASKEVATNLRRAMSLYINRMNNPASFDKYIELAIRKDPRVAAAYQRMLGMDATEAEYAKSLTQFTDAQGDLLIARKLLKDKQMFYGKQIWDTDPTGGAVGKVLGKATKGERVWLSIPEGIVRGGRISEDSLDIVKSLNRSSNINSRAIFTQDLLQAMTESGMGRFQTSGQSGLSFNVVNDKRVSQSVRDHFSQLEKAVGDPEQGWMAISKFRVDQAGKDFLEKLLGTRTGSGTPLKTLQDLKAVKVSMGFFHHFQMFQAWAWSHAFDNPAALADIAPRQFSASSMSDMYRSMPAIQRGIDIMKEGSPRLQQLQQLGLRLGHNPDEFRESASKVFGIPRGSFEKLGHSALWDVAWRNLKAEDAMYTAGKLIDKLGPNASDTEIEQTLRTVTKALNDRYGGLDYLRMNIGSGILGLSRQILFATDWKMSNARQLISAATNTPVGQLSRGQIVRALIGSMVAGQTASFVINGRGTWDNNPGMEMYVKTKITDAKGNVMYVPIGLLGSLDLGLKIAYATGEAAGDVVRGHPGSAVADIARPVESTLAPGARAVSEWLKSSAASRLGMDPGTANVYSGRAIEELNPTPIAAGQGGVGGLIQDVRRRGLGALPSELLNAIGVKPVTEPKGYQPGPSTIRQFQQDLRRDRPSILGMPIPDWVVRQIEEGLFKSPKRPGLPKHTSTSPDFIPPQ